MEGSRMIPTTTGNRDQKVLCLVQYIMTEQRAVDGDTGISEFWRADTPVEKSLYLENEEVQYDVFHLKCPFRKIVSNFFFITAVFLQTSHSLIR